MSAPHERYYRDVGLFTRWTYLTIGSLLIVIGLAMYVWFQQLTQGLGVTGLNRPVTWGIYMANFVFFISVSMSGTFISAMIRLLRLEWGRPITRIAEVITVGSLIIAALNILFDVGQLFRALVYIPLYGRIQSPVGWDVIVLLFYLLTGLGYLHIGLIPDVAVLSERSSRFSSLYNLLRFDWTGSESQKHFLESALKVLAVVTIPIAVMMHTVTGWIFGGMKAVPTWNDALYGPYFIIGALLSGLSLIIVTSAVIRVRYKLHDVIPNGVFVNLGKILVVLLLGYLYFFLAETFTVRYAAVPEDMHVSEFTWTGSYAPLTWYVLASLIVPAVVLLIPPLRTHKAVVAAAAAILPAMWVKRVMIVVPGLLNQLRLQTVQTVVPGYIPTYVEALITTGSFAGLAVMLLLFTKLFPPIPVWELFGPQRTRTEPTSRFSLRAVFTSWAAGISVCSAFVFSWVVVTLIVAGDEAVTVYAVGLTSLGPQLLKVPELLTTPMLRLLVMVVLAGIFGLLLVRRQ